MIVALTFLSMLSLVSYTESECSVTSYYRDCWIRRFPGLHVDAEESELRGAQLLQSYRGDSAQNCSRACCLTSNFSCNVAVFHYNTTQDNANCFHLHCPTLQSCVLHHRANVIMYNVTKGMDPDLLIFGKPFPSNAQVLPHLASFNIADSSGTDKRQFNRPHIEPSSSAHPTILVTTTKTSTSMPTTSHLTSTALHLSVYSTKHNQETLPAIEIQQSITQPPQLISTRVIANPTTYYTIVSNTKASEALSSQQTSFSSMPQTTHTFSTRMTASHPSSQFTPSATFSSELGPLGITTTAFTISQAATTEFKTGPYLYMSTIFSSGHTTTNTPYPFLNTLQSTTGETSTISVPLTNTPESTGESTTTPLSVKTPTRTVPVSSSLRSNTRKTTTTIFSNAPQRITEETTLLGILQRRTKNTPTLTVPLPSTLQRGSGKATSSVSSFSSAPQTITEETTNVPVPPSSILQIRTKNTPTLTFPLSSTREEVPTPPVPLSSIPHASKDDTETNTTLGQAQQRSASASLTPTPTFSPEKITTAYAPLTTVSQLMSNSLTHPQLGAAPVTEKRITTSSTTVSVSQEYTNIKVENTVASVTTISPTTLNKSSSSVAASPANSGPHTSATTPTVLEDSQPYPNDTKGYFSRNVTAGNSPQPVSDGGLLQVWHLAANTILIALATCAALVCGCCCSVLMAASWRGRKRRKGRYQTLLKGKTSSMRLIKYVFIRESS